MSSKYKDNIVQSNRIIYTPSSFAKANLIHLQEIGRLKAMAPHVSKRENLPSFLFFMVEEGSGFLEYGSETYGLNAGHCVFLDCRRPYAQHSSEDLWTLRWVHFYGPNMSGIYDKYLERGGKVCFHPEDTDVYSGVLQSIYDIAGQNSYIRDMEIFERLTSLLTILMAQSWSMDKGNSTTSKKRDMKSVKEYLDDNYQTRISLDMLAEKFYINKFYMTRLFKEQYGVSVNNYLLQVRVTHAKRLLRFSDLSIESIGQECGMEDANYFSRMFKKVEGMTPGEFRKMW